MIKVLHNYPKKSIFVIFQMFTLAIDIYGHIFTFKSKWIDFHHVCNLFLVGNDKSIFKHQNTKDRNFAKFLILM